MAFCACAILILICGIVLYSLTREKPAAIAKVGITTSDDVVVFPANLFSDGNARHFEYKNNNITIRYFILKSSDGVIRAAFDACDVCWPAGKGYYQKADTMVCRNCGRRFASVLVNEVKGGCNPAPLNRDISGDKLIIRTTDILKGKKYFDFSGKV
jgi:uncharacterized membrane protein